MTVNYNSFRKQRHIRATIEGGDITGGGSDVVTLDIDASALSGNEFIYLYQVRDSSGAAKTGYISSYSTVTGLLSIQEQPGSVFAAGDTIDIQGALA